MESQLRRLRSNRLSIGQREIFSQAEVESRRNTLCISRLSKRRIAEKDPLIRRSAVARRRPIKRERGEFFIHPAVAPVSRMSVFSTLWCYPRVCSLGGQNLAALCTAAGQNLAAVGSSHSLTETVDLGTMTAAGLVGTLHLHYTSC